MPIHGGEVTTLCSSVGAATYLTATTDGLYVVFSDGIYKLGKQ